MQFHKRIGTVLQLTIYLCILYKRLCCRFYDILKVLTNFQIYLVTFELIVRVHILREKYSVHVFS